MNPAARSGTHFTAKACIECDACVDVCPVSCLTITPDGDEAELRGRLTAPAVNPTQPLYGSVPLPQTGRVMVKDEDICLHCGLCAERCPTSAWDMRTFELLVPYAGQEARVRVRADDAVLTLASLASAAAAARPAPPALSP